MMNYFKNHYLFYIFIYNIVLIFYLVLYINGVNLLYMLTFFIVSFFCVYLYVVYNLSSIVLFYNAIWYIIYIVYLNSLGNTCDVYIFSDILLAFVLLYVYIICNFLYYYYNIGIYYYIILGITLFNNSILYLLYVKYSISIIFLPNNISLYNFFYVCLIMCTLLLFFKKDELIYTYSSMLDNFKIIQYVKYNIYIYGYIFIVGMSYRYILLICASYKMKMPISIFFMQIDSNMLLYNTIFNILCYSYLFVLVQISMIFYTLYLRCGGVAISILLDRLLSKYLYMSNYNFFQKSVSYSTFLCFLVGIYVYRVCLFYILYPVGTAPSTLILLFFLLLFVYDRVCTRSIYGVYIIYVVFCLLVFFILYRLILGYICYVVLSSSNFYIFICIFVPIVVIFYIASSSKPLLMDVSMDEYDVMHISTVEEEVPTILNRSDQLPNTYYLLYNFIKEVDGNVRKILDKNPEIFKNLCKLQFNVHLKSRREVSESIAAIIIVLIKRRLKLIFSSSSLYTVDIINLIHSGSFNGGGKINITDLDYDHKTVSDILKFLFNKELQINMESYEEIYRCIYIISEKVLMNSQYNDVLSAELRRQVLDYVIFFMSENVVFDLHSKVDCGIFMLDYIISIISCNMHFLRTEEYFYNTYHRVALYDETNNKLNISLLDLVSIFFKIRYNIYDYDLKIFCNSMTVSRMNIEFRRDFLQCYPLYMVVGDTQVFRIHFIDIYISIADLYNIYLNHLFELLLKSDETSRIFILKCKSLSYKYASIYNDQIFINLSVCVDLSSEIDILLSKYFMEVCDFKFKLNNSISALKYFLLIFICTFDFSKPIITFIYLDSLYNDALLNIFYSNIYTRAPGTEWIDLVDKLD